MTDDLARALSAIVGHFGQISSDPSTPRKQMDGSRLNISGWQAQPPLSTALQLTDADFLIDPSHNRPSAVETLLGAPTQGARANCLATSNFDQRHVPGNGDCRPG